jgi:formylmethanofuran dehydrogenase subunit B
VSPSELGPVTCLGCGCGCDDLRVRVADGRIADLSPPCPVARAWLGDGRVPSAVRVNGREASVRDALREAATVLAGAVGRALVVLAPDISVQAQCTALALADRLRAAVDSATSDAAAAGLLAAQRRGRAAATLGELRNRADAVLFWAVDPGPRYPRYQSRYAPDPVGTHVPEGRSGRTVISVSVGADRGPDPADVGLVLALDQEIPALSVMRAVALGNPLGELPAPLDGAAAIAGRLIKARYVAVVHEAEPGLQPERDRYRAEGLLGLADALNGPTRAALSSLRAGGNRNGAEAALTWQTGYPMAVSFEDGTPAYTPDRRALADSAAMGAVLVVGAVAAVAPALERAAAKVPVIVIGPRASEASFPARIAIDTGVAGIHEGGTAYRMDDVPLPLSPPLAEAGARSAADTIAALLEEVLARPARGTP